jgi:cytochrome b
MVTRVALQPVRVWDLPTRLVHWSFALAVPALIVTARVGGNAMAWHFRLGYLMLALLAFRMVWGVVGGRWSRFSRFAFGPGAMGRYLGGRPRPDDHFDVGHNPLGALSVFALLGILFVQVATGLFADDEIASTGPLIRFVSGDTSLALTRWHKGIGQWVIIALVVLHLMAILFHTLKKRRNLVGPMLVGDKSLAADVPPSADGWRQRLMATTLLLVCAAGTAWLVSLGD